MSMPSGWAGKIWAEKIVLSGPDTPDYHPRNKWCGEKFGLYKDRWYVVNNWKVADYYFKNSEDATLFVLRWA